MQSSTNQSLNHGDNGENPKPHHKGPSIDNSGRRQDTFKKCPFPNPQRSPLRAYRVDDNFTPLKLPIQDVFKPSRVNPE